jgi:hypothetical protein
MDVWGRVVRFPAPQVLRFMNIMEYCAVPSMMIKLIYLIQWNCMLLLLMVLPISFGSVYLQP